MWPLAMTGEGVDLLQYVVTSIVTSKNRVYVCAKAHGSGKWLIVTIVAFSVSIFNM